MKCSFLGWNLRSVPSLLQSARSAALQRLHLGPVGSLWPHCSTALGYIARGRSATGILIRFKSSTFTWHVLPRSCVMTNIRSGILHMVDITFKRSPMTLLSTLLIVPVVIGMSKWSEWSRRVWWRTEVQGFYVSTYDCPTPKQQNHYKTKIDVHLIYQWKMFSTNIPESSHCSWQVWILSHFSKLL